MRRPWKTMTSEPPRQSPDESDRAGNYLINVMAAWGGVALALMSLAFIELGVGDWHADPPVNTAREMPPTAAETP